MGKNQNSELDYLELNPPSSPALKENLDSVLDSSQNWNAAIESLDRKTGDYRIIVEGTLKGDTGR